MLTNEGTVDRVIRLVVAVVAAVAAFSVGAGSVLGIILLVVGAVMLLTAVTGFCPLYRVLGLRTRPMQDARTR
jgi:zinc transporter ZupT